MVNKIKSVSKSVSKFVGRNKYKVAKAAVLSVSFVSGYMLGKILVDTIKINGVNEFLYRGDVVWADGLPVEVDGVLVSGNPNWTPAESKVSEGVFRIVK